MINTPDPAQFLDEPDVISHFSEVTGSFYSRKAALAAVQQALDAQRQEIHSLRQGARSARLLRIRRLVAGVGRQEPGRRHHRGTEGRVPLDA